MIHELQREYRHSSASPAEARSDVAAYLAEVGHSEPRSPRSSSVSWSQLDRARRRRGHVAGKVGWRDLPGRCQRSRRRCARGELPRRLGREFAIVDAFATAWGVTHFDGTGRVTWFELGSSVEVVYLVEAGDLHDCHGHGRCTADHETRAAAGQAAVRYDQHLQTR
jgi:hypothetical protein